jgi:hypothetical protein
MSTTARCPTMADRTFTIVASLFVSLLGFASPAVAAPVGEAGPEQEACADRASGDACSLPNNQLGTCGEAVCSRLDYSGGSPPKSIEGPCVICKAAGSQPHGGPPILGGDGGDGGADPAADGGADSGTEPSTSTSDGKEPPKTSSKCTVEDQAPNTAGLAMLAGLILLGWCRRSRNG